MQISKLWKTHTQAKILKSLLEFNNWAQTRNINPDIENYTPAELNKILKLFYTELRKADGHEYEPNCLRIMISSIDR